MSDVLVINKQRDMYNYIDAYKTKLETDKDNLTADEKGTVQQLKWFSLDEIIHCDEIIYPVCLARYLKPVLGGDIPRTPIELEFS